MKGLLYKDFVNAKGCIALAFFYLFYVFAMVEVIAVDFNAAVGLQEKFAVLSGRYLILLSCIFVSCLIPTSMATAICCLDGKTKWTNYALALPGGYRNIVKEKFIIVLLGHMISVVASLAVVVLSKHYFEVEVDGIEIEDMGADIFILLMLVIIGLSLIGNAFIIPLVCRSKENWIEILGLVCLVIVIYALMAYISLGDISFIQDGNLMEKLITWIANHEKEVWEISYGLVGVGVMSQIVSYLVTVKTYLKCV